MRDFIWTERYVTDLVDGAHLEDLGDGVLRSIDARFPTYYEQKCAAYDTGNPEAALDAIQLDIAMDRMTDMPAKLALLARLHGWDFSDIGVCVADRRRRRTGGQLVESAVKAIARSERRRAAQ